MLGMTAKQSFYAEVNQSSVNQSSDDKIKVFEFPIKILLVLHSSYWVFATHLKQTTAADIFLVLNEEANSDRVVLRCSIKKVFLKIS